MINYINKLLNISENLTGDEMVNMVKDYVKSSVNKNLDKFYESYAKSTKKAMKKITSINQLKKENVIISLSEILTAVLFVSLYNEAISSISYSSS